MWDQNDEEKVWEINMKKRVEKKKRKKPNHNLHQQ